MGQWTDYFRIVQPRPPHKDYVQDNAGSSVYNNYTWYTRAMKSAASRFSKYQQYNNMDNDVDVARALDTIAEEMTSENSKTNLPLDIVYQNEDNKEVDENITMVLRAALRRFVSIQSLNSGVFEIARDLIKYGDTFFQKTSDLKKWISIDHLDIVGIMINEDTNEILSYQVRRNNKKSGGVSNQIDSIPALGMVHFTLASALDSQNPYGESILRPAMKAYKQLAMLEDAVIIYRIVRAPERRVFFLDVGNMPPQKIKAYLESVNNDVKQKRIPNVAGGGEEKIDSVINPMSMIEDYYFAQTANGRGSRVETLSGGESLGEIADLNYFQNKFFKGLRIPSSYMRGQNSEGAQIQDGKVGLAYFEEQKFANFVKRLQNKLSPVFDKHFKQFLKTLGIKIDPNLFRLEMVEPQNFTKYRDAAINAELLSNFGNIKDIPYFSKRMIMKNYLGWTEDDIQANEIKLKQEKNIPEKGLADNLSDLRMIYDEKWNESRPQIKVPEEYDSVTIRGEGEPVASEQPLGSEEELSSSPELGGEGPSGPEEIPPEGEEETLPPEGEAPGAENPPGAEEGEIPPPPKVLPGI